MKFFNIFFLTFLLFSMWGCNHTIKNAEEFRLTEASKKDFFEIQMNYQQAFKIVSELSKKCLKKITAANKTLTEETLDTEKRVGEILLINDNIGWGKDIYGSYVFKYKSENLTEVSLYLIKNPMNIHGLNNNLIKAWLSGNKTCVREDSK